MSKNGEQRTYESGPRERHPVDARPDGELGVVVELGEEVREVQYNLRDLTGYDALYEALYKVLDDMEPEEDEDEFGVEIGDRDEWRDK